jgi:cyclic pyranopterin monophosphate synthase
MTLSHIDKNNQPAMVDVSAKTATKRTAHAQTIVALPDDVRALFGDGDFHTKKGPVFQTAIVAGVMAAKKTPELIPLCHPIGLEDCQIDIALNDDGDVVIDCTCTVTHKTGVEMEALTGASVAALTVYDMLKAISHDIAIRETRLIEKTGGKSDYRLQP